VGPPAASYLRRWVAGGGAKGGAVTGVRVRIIRLVDRHQPGFVECELVDAHGERWSFVEKAPVVSTETLDERTAYPRPGVIACEVLERLVSPNGDVLVRISTRRPWGVEASGGQSTFDVTTEQLCEP